MLQAQSCTLIGVPPQRQGRRGWRWANIIYHQGSSLLRKACSMNRSRVTLWCPVALTAVLSTVGCFPQSQPPVVEGRLDTNTAAQLQAKLRSSQSEKYSVTHRWKDQEFAANWELSNALKKSSQLQTRLPVEWSEGDLYQALVIILEDHTTKPWYGQIDETVLRLLREALQESDHRASDVAPDSPYAVAVMVVQHTAEWFVEVKVQILEEDGTSIGF
jgi:hypothetical protein